MNFAALLPQSSGTNYMPLPAQRVVFGDCFVQRLLIQVGVDFRSRDVLVAEQFLNNPNICSVLQQVRSKRVAQCMRTNCLCDTRLCSITANNIENHHSGQWFTQSAQVDYCAICWVSHCTALFEIDIDHLHRSGIDGHKSHFIPLTYYSDKSIIEKQVGSF